MRHVARCLLLAALLLPAALRRLPSPVARACAPEGRGAAPRVWLGCAADPGPRRALAGDERLLLGLPLDVNGAGARELAFVPGIGAGLAAAVVADRERSGPFLSPEELLRIHGIGPKRLARARPFLFAAPRAVGVAPSAE